MQVARISETLHEFQFDFESKFIVHFGVALWLLLLSSLLSSLIPKPQRRDWLAQARKGWFPKLSFLVSRNMALVRRSYASLGSSLHKRILSTHQQHRIPSLLPLHGKSSRLFHGQVTITSPVIADIQRESIQQAVGDTAPLRSSIVISEMQEIIEGYDEYALRGMVDKMHCTSLRCSRFPRALHNLPRCSLCVPTGSYIQRLSLLSYSFKLISHMLTNHHHTAPLRLSPSSHGCSQSSAMEISSIGTTSRNYPSIEWSPS